MGTYITTAVETLGQAGWSENKAAVFTNDPRWTDETSELTRLAFFWQDYTMFSLLADVRSRDQGIVPIAPGRGLPDDASDSALNQILGGWGAHGWCYPGGANTEFNTVRQKVENRNRDETYGFSWLSASELQAVNYDAQITAIVDPLATQTLREALGKRYFEHLDQLSQVGSPDHVRILFCFSG